MNRTPTISDWNRIEDWLNGISRFVGYAFYTDVFFGNLRYSKKVAINLIVNSLVLYE